MTHQDLKQLYFVLFLLQASVVFNHHVLGVVFGVGGAFWAFMGFIRPERT